MSLINLNDFALLILLLLDVGMILACIIAIAKGCLKPDGSFATTDQGSLTLEEAFYTTGASIIVALFSLVWVPADSFYRRMQPFAGMALPKQAEEKYPAGLHWTKRSTSPIDRNAE
jgi:hypothetical protein